MENLLSGLWDQNHAWQPQLHWERCCQCQFVFESFSALLRTGQGAERRTPGDVSSQRLAPNMVLKGYCIPSIQDAQKHLGKTLLNAPERRNCSSPRNHYCQHLAAHKIQDYASYIWLSFIQSLRELVHRRSRGLSSPASVFCCRGRAMPFTSSSGRPARSRCLRTSPPPAPATRGWVRCWRCYFGWVFLLEVLLSRENKSRGPRWYF